MVYHTTEEINSEMFAVKTLLFSQKDWLDSSFPARNNTRSFVSVCYEDNISQEKTQWVNTADNTQISPRNIKTCNLKSLST